MSKHLAQVFLCYIRRPIGWVSPSASAQVPPRLHRASARLIHRYRKSHVALRETGFGMDDPSAQNGHVTSALTNCLPSRSSASRSARIAFRKPSGDARQLCGFASGKEGNIVDLFSLARCEAGMVIPSSAQVYVRQACVSPILELACSCQTADRPPSGSQRLR